MTSTAEGTPPSDAGEVDDSRQMKALMRLFRRAGESEISERGAVGTAGGEALVTEGDPDAAGRPTRADGAFLGLGITATTLGLCLLLFFAYVYSFSGFQETRSQHALLNEYTTTDRAKLLSARQQANGQPAGVLQIPTLGVKQVVVQGSTATDLLKGPGLVPGTAPPGSLGNAVIAGHREIAGAPFANLARLHPGDQVYVTTVLGRYDFEVTQVGQARPGAPDPMSPKRHPELTLVTSSPSLPGGRLFVVSKLLSTPNSAQIPRRPPTVTERRLDGDGSAVTPAILLGVLFGLVVVATLLAYRKWRANAWAIYLLTTPVTVAAALLWYGQLIRLLPGTM
jgi:sortase A